MSQAVILVHTQLELPTIIIRIIDSCSNRQKFLVVHKIQTEETKNIG